MSGKKYSSVNWLFAVLGLALDGLYVYESLLNLSLYGTQYVVRTSIIGAVIAIAVLYSVNWFVIDDLGITHCRLFCKKTFLWEEISEIQICTQKIFVRVNDPISIECAMISKGESKNYGFLRANSVFSRHSMAIQLNSAENKAIFIAPHMNQSEFLVFVDKFHHSTHTK